MKKNIGHPVNLLSKSQEAHYFGTLKVDEIHQTLYKNLFNRDSEEINRSRFQLVAGEELATIVKEFPESLKLFSKEQEEYYFSHLKAADVDGYLYHHLFANDPSETNKARFQLLSKEEIPAFQVKFKVESHLTEQIEDQGMGT